MELILKKSLIIIILLFVSMSFVGCGGAIKQQSKSNGAIKISTSKKIGEAYISTKEILDVIFLKEKKSSKDKKLISNLIKMNVITKKENIFKFNSLNEMIKNQTFGDISHTHDNLVILSKVIGNKKSKITFIVYYDKENRFVKVAQFSKYVGRLTLSDDGRLAFAWRKRNVIDLTNYKIIQTFSKFEFYDVKSKMYFTNRTIENLKFSPENTYLTYVVRYDGTKEDHLTGILKRISDKKQFYGDRFVRIPDTYPHNVYSNISDNEKYIINDSFGAVENWEHTAGAFPIYAIPSKKHIKILNMPEKHGMPHPYATWKNDILFYYYYTYDDTEKSFKGNSGIYDIENNQFYCENIADSVKSMAIRKLVWNEQDDNLYMFSSGKVYPFILKNNKCYPMESYFHDIEALSNDKYDHKFIKDKSKIIIYSTDKSTTKISEVYLKRFTQADIVRFNNIKKAEKLLNIGFEERGLKLLESLIDENVVPIFETNKHLHAYKMYLSTKVFNKTIVDSDKPDTEIWFNYKQMIKYLSWYGYENLIPEINKKFRNAINEKRVNFDNAKQYLTIGESIYLLSINKNNEAYEKLFNLQPLSKYSKYYVSDLTRCKSNFTQSIDKISVATDVPKEELKKPVDCTGTYPFFFDINGIKVFKGEVAQKAKPRKQLKQAEKDEAIELLD